MLDELLTRCCWVGGRGRRGVFTRPEGRRPRRRWQDNIKMDLREMGLDGANCLRIDPGGGLL
jgi:hypothetical protein